MRKKGILLACLVIAICLLALATREHEPCYKGKPLRSWLDDLADYSVSQREEAKQAVLQIGSNAVPSLVRYIRYSPPFGKKSAVTAFNKLSRYPITGHIIPCSLTYDVAEVRAETAIQSFHILGQAGSAAYPQLTRLACDATQPEVSTRAIKVLVFTSGATNAVHEVLSHACPQIQFETLIYMGQQSVYFPPRVLWPDLIQLLHSGDDDVIRLAAALLVEVKHSQPEAMLAIFIDALRSPKFKVRTQALVSIETFDTAAIPVVPLVTPLLDDPDLSVRKEATNFLRMFAPAAFTTPQPH
jgi:hypothetical protein